MPSSSNSSELRSTVTGVVLFTMLAFLLLMARCERASDGVARPNIGREVIDTGVNGAVPAVVGGQPKPALDPLEADQTVIEVKRQLEVANQRLEKNRQEIEALARKPERPVAVIDDFNHQREQLEQQIATLMEQIAAAEGESRKVREELVRAREEQKQRLAEAARGAVAQGLGRGRMVDQQVKLDPIRFRDPAMRDLPSSPAATAAAASAPAVRGGGGIGWGSTAFGDMARGEAERVRAAGEFNLNSSKAAINMQTAKSMEMDNRLRWTETFFEMRRVNRAARALEAGPRPTMEQIVTYARMGRPPRLSSLSLDSVTGDVTWPLILRDERFHQETQAIEACFKERAAAAGSLDFTKYARAESLFGDLEDKLKAHVNEYPAQKYGQARTFVESLKQEFDYPVK